MTTSGTYTWNPAIDDLLTEAWERLGLTTAALTGAVARSARRSLQLMLVDWTNRAVPLWQVEDVTLPLMAGTAAYTLDASTVEALEVTINVAGIDRVLAPISRDVWAAIPNKATQSLPTQYWCERALPAPVLHVWPVPDSAYTLTYWRLRLPQDVGALGNTPDAPVLWGDALAAGLAARLAVKFAPARAADLAAMAETAFTRASGEDRNRVPLTINISRRR